MNNVEDTILTNFENHYMKIREKMVTRLAVKVVAALVSKKIAEEAAKNIGGDQYGDVASFLIGTLTGVGVGAILFSSEKPDLRCWHSIPASYQAGSVLLPPGKYEGMISYFNRNGLIVNTESTGEFTVSREKPFILLFRTYK